MINVIWRFTCDFKKFSHERIKIINNFISSKIRNERFDEEEINRLTELSKWREDWEGDEQVTWEPVGVCVKQQLITRVWCAYQCSA